MKRNIAAISAVLMAVVFLVSGLWKVLRPFTAGELLEQAKVPAGLGTAGALSLGTVEILCAVLLLLPQFRKLGGLLGAGLMSFFIVWIAYYYPALHGQECSCFPIIKRAVGPMFFVEDGIMLALCLVALAWSPKIIAGVSRLRVPAVLFLLLIALAGTSYAVNVKERSHAQLPTPLIVDGKPEDLTHGKVLLFFYDPGCEHCDAAARYMATLNWGDTKIVGIPTVMPQWAPSFIHDTKLKAETSLETKKLRQIFKFGDPPFGVALEDGQVKQTYTALQFTPPAPSADLKKIGFVH